MTRKDRPEILFMTVLAALGLLATIALLSLGTKPPSHHEHSSASGEYAVWHPQELGNVDRLFQQAMWEMSH